ncbi:radical SAM protein [Thalassomonas haliotis]|uniref:Radical SAM protein n=1 Tax=Thalassomonas haliotis TaxID=485448 RepID=A0ABY7VKR1_9GAMM|nr:radical SAM protein [Thalassomonas haliotis]WDE14342.1 radical SAM protein [Thalassomonas haliotis]
MNFAKDFKKSFITSTSDGFLHLIILPTEKCNFRCLYCYEDFSIGKMSQDTVEGIKNLLINSAPCLKKLVVSWFGGEPTLNSQVIIEISRQIQQLKEKHDFQYLADMTTNGYLLDKNTLEAFINLGITHYQVSLDGTGQAHDKTRVRINGQGTFDRIWQNLLSFQSSHLHFSILLRMHVTKTNGRAMLALAHLVRRNFGKDKRYHTFVRGISNLGKSVRGDVSEYVPKDKQGLDALISKIKVILAGEGEKTVNNEYQTKPGDQESSDNKSNDTDNNDKADNPYICYAAKPRQLLIRADGRLAKCTIMFDDDRNNLGKINRDGSLDLDGQKMALWTRGFASLDKSELACPAKALPRAGIKGELIAINKLA